MFENKIHTYVHSGPSWITPTAVAAAICQWHRRLSACTNAGVLTPALGILNTISHSNTVVITNLLLILVTQQDICQWAYLFSCIRSVLILQCDLIAYTSYFAS